LEKVKIAIVGAGASSLISSYILAKKNFDVTVFEKNSKVGRKLLTTGNGRCNITNETIKVQNFHSSNIEFIKPILEQFTYKKCKEFFSDLGIEFVKGQKTRVYPISLTASSVVDIFVDEIKNLGVNIKLDSFIEKIEYKNNKFILNENEKFDKVIIATGSKAMPKLGSCDFGYKVAKEFGHNIIEPYPSLVQLVSDNKDLDIITGVKVDGIANNVKGDILFTKYGLSGTAILDLSREISYNLQYEQKQKVVIDILPSMQKNRIVDILLKRSKKYPHRDLVLFLDGLINKKLAKYIIIKSKIQKEIKKAGFLTRKDIMNIVYNIKNLSFNIIDTKGFETSEISAGGVDVSQINNKTFESKLQKDLYFIGEVLDVDGDCGGFNLHFAWASGYIVAKNMI
jgi:predicted Rossmann fold flavoprotein